MRVYRSRFPKAKNGELPAISDHWSCVLYTPEAMRFAKNVMIIVKYWVNERYSVLNRPCQSFIKTAPHFVEKYVYPQMKNDASILIF